MVLDDFDGKTANGSLELKAWFARVVLYWPLCEENGDVLRHSTFSHFRWYNSQKCNLRWQSVLNHLMLYYTTLLPKLMSLFHILSCE